MIVPTCVLCSPRVENGRTVKIRGDPEQDFIAGFACTKVNRDMDPVYAPERLTTPLRRSGPEGSGVFEPITWDVELEEIVARW
jgi:anaerobic selenocysteine-containing dehydrogenase